KELNEFYFVLVDTDGDKIVFSWNEIFNTEAGNTFYIITEMDGKKLKDMEQKIIFISTSDLKSGRRYIKALEKIQVKRAE
ncbi:MAG: molybdopterin-binding protein, partial [Bacteroidota bacterium]